MTEGLGRYAPYLPVRPLSLGEPVTELVELDWGGDRLLAKLEGSLPTGSFKDRGSAVLVADLAARGVGHIVCDSSGNAGASLAAYCARAGIRCDVYVPASAAPAKLVQARAYGASIVPVEGPRAEATAAARRAAASGSAVYATHLREDAFLAGTQTFALELWEQLGHSLPAAVVVPVGGGTLLLGIERGFAELRRRGLADRIPPLYGVQTERCAPLATAFERGAPIEPAPFSDPSLAEGILLTDPPHGAAVVRAVGESGGSLVAVGEDEIAEAMRELARRGIYVEPTSAVAAAGATRLRQAGRLPASGPIVLGLTGTGLKATAAIAAILESAP